MKRSLIIVVALALALSFPGCAAREDMPTTAAMEEEEEAEVVITEEEEEEPEVAEVVTTEEEAEEPEVAEVVTTEEEAEEPEVAEAEEPEAVIEIAAVKMMSMSDISIKVLNGNGKRGSAKAMRGRLKSFGYTIERIDNAPKFTFSRNVVFYAEEFNSEAEALAETLGGSAITKPLTWYSIFDIIVVTGKRP